MTGGGIVGFAAAQPERVRLPARRECLSATIAVGGRDYAASVGFDPLTGQPRELFLSGAKDGTDMAAILADTAVVVSIALQYGVPAGALAHSVTRLPAAGAGAEAVRAASVIGAALDLLVQYEAEDWR